MVNSVFENGLNDRGAVEYNTDQESHNNMVSVMKGGDPEITKQLILKNRNKWKYTSGVLSFTERNLSLKKKHKIMQLFEETFLPGIKQGNYNILWAQHLDKGTLELHWIVPRIELSTGRALAVYTHIRDIKKNDLFQSYINAKYNLVSPMPKDEYITLKYKDSKGEVITIYRSDTKSLKKELDKQIAWHGQDNKERYSTGKFDSVYNKEILQQKPINKGKINDGIRRKIDGLNGRNIKNPQQRSESTADRTAEWTESTQRAERLNNRVAADAYRKRRRCRADNSIIQKVGGDISGVLGRLFELARRKTEVWLVQLASQEEERLIKEKRERETEEEMKNFHPYDIDSQSVLDWLENQSFDEDDQFMDHAPIYSDDDLDIQDDDLNISKDKGTTDETIQPDQKKTKKKKRKLRKL